MGLFSKVKKAFKRVVAHEIRPIKAIAKAVVKAVTAVVRTIAKLEALVYDAAYDLTEALNIGPSFLTSIISRVTGVVYDALMSSSRLKLGVGLIALGALSRDKGMRLEGRLELLTSSMYFMRMSGAVPQWLMMIILIIASWFIPFIWFAFAAVAGYAVFTTQIPKLADDPEEMMRHLVMLREMGLLDKDTASMVDLYLEKINRTDLKGNVDAANPKEGVDFKDLVLEDYFDFLREQLKDRDNSGGGIFPTDPIVFPEADYGRGGFSVGFVGVAMAVALAVLLSKKGN